MKISTKKIRIYAATLALVHLLDVISPMQLFALTAGPSSPEFSSFEPVATTNMVNMFGGDFTYNLPALKIPGPDGGGYSMSLSYHAGATAEEEASWVGFGWTLNPGAINRQARGIPDDANGQEVVKYNKVRPNWTSATNFNGGIEFFSQADEKERLEAFKNTSFEDMPAGVSIDASKAIRFNNYVGVSVSSGLSSSFFGMGSLGFTKSSSGVTFSAKVNPLTVINRIKKAKKKKKEEQPETTSDEESNSPPDSEETSTNQELTKKFKLEFKQKNSFKDALKKNIKALANGYTSAYGVHSLGSFDHPSSVTPLNGVAYNWSLSAQVNFGPVPVGIHGGVAGNFNIQVNEPKQTIKEYGYLYNPSETEMNDDVLSDYSVEKGSTFDNRDYFMGMPFNGADAYAVAGEGISGSFRPHLLDVGHHYPTFTETDQKIKNINIEFGVMANMEIGFGFGRGYQFTKLKSWQNPSNGTPSKNEGNHQFTSNSTSNMGRDQAARPFFRFNNDLGGNVEYSSVTDLATGTIPSGVSIPGSKRCHLDIASLNFETTPYADNTKAGRSSFVDYSVKGASGDDIDNVESNQTAQSAATSGAITEFAVTNAGGMRYVYGLPVFTQDGLDLSFPMDRFADYASDPASFKIEDNFLGYRYGVDLDDLNANQFIVGSDKREHNVKQITNHLLTQITTPDYVDVTDNGPSDDDFGGWTKFGYKRLYSASSNEYQFRSPYTGLYFSEGSISDTKDDMGSFSSGYKDVHYLQTIETKSHIAFFVTNQTSHSDFTEVDASGSLKLQDYLSGSGDQRPDGLPADNTSAAIETADAKDPNHKLRYLEKIVLVAKSDLSSSGEILPSKVVNFAYDWSLAKNLPNSEFGNYPGNGGQDHYKSGKLTLKKVWFEYEGVVSAKVAPYEFEYEYKKLADFNLPAHVASKYNSLFTDTDLLSDYAQNPDYNPHALDAWGNIQHNGHLRKDKRQTWLDQRPPSGLFDPAAWQLKQIKLPSGGEIHVHYEQKDYNYVQDRDPMALVSLKSVSKDGGNPLLSTGGYRASPNNNFNKYYLNISDIVGSGTVDLVGLKDYLKDYFKVTGEEDEKEKIYFKFLYALTGSSPALDDCHSEYLTGYTSVREIGTDLNGIYLSLGTPIVNNAPLGFFKGGDRRRDIPREVCFQYTVTQRGGKLENGNCRGKFEDEIEEEVHSKLDTEMDFDNIDGNGNRLQFQKDVVAKALLKTGGQALYRAPKRAQVCKSVAWDLSYLKIPIKHLQPKKGGGIRVKRLLTFDPGLEGHDAMLFGSEYHYKDEDGNSSGVATNEPSAIREENALIGFIAKKKKSFVGRLISGRDREQTEGPIGESLLPGASVGHSRVVVENIHKGASNTGYQVHEFYTVKDYPFDMNYPDLGIANCDISGPATSYTSLKENKKRDWLKLPTPFLNLSIDKRWYTQGFRFVLNDMHGKPKKESHYGGKYDSGQSTYLSSYTAYEYFEPGEKVPVLDLKKNNSGDHEFVLTKEILGKEEDVTMEIKTVEDKTFDFELEMDIGIGLVIPPPVTVSFGLSLGYIENEMNTHVTTKVYRYTSMLKSTSSFKDGIKHKTENLAFNKLNGSAVVTAEEDAYHATYTNSGGSIQEGVYYTYGIPAAWVYDKLGQMAADPSNKNMLEHETGNLKAYGVDGNWLAASANKFGVANNDGEQYWNPYANGKKPTGVVSAKMQTYAKNWYTDISAGGSMEQVANEYGLSSSTQPALDQLNSNYRLWNEYAYKSSVTSANAAGNSNATSGVFEDFVMFDWDNASSTDVNTSPTAQTSTSTGNWVRISSIAKYSPNGTALENVSLPNSLALKSATRYGYNKMLPVMMGQNASYSSIYFDDFENNASGSNLNAHSGRKAIDYSAIPNHKFVAKVNGLKLDNQLIDNNGLVMFWVNYSSGSSTTSNIPSNNINVVLNGSTSKVAERVAMAGEWMLYRAYLDDWGTLASGDDIEFTIDYPINLGAGEELFIDDFRFQPANASGACYSYDVNKLKLSAQFDDQHFGLFYQYDYEGRLKRKLKETERGMVTLQDAHTNQPKRATL